MAVRYTLVHQDATTLPTTAATQYSNGINIPGGIIDEFIIRITGTVTAADVLSDFANTISQLRLILNGDDFFDYRVGYGSSIQATGSQLGYMMNSMGPGRSTELMGATAKEYFLRVPCGRVVQPGVSRLEYQINYNLLATTSMVGAANAGFEIYVRYNDAVQNTTTIGAATTFNYSATNQQVIVRLPANVPGALAAIYVQNDRATETDITQFRIVSQSDYSLSTTMWRALNGDLQGIKVADQGNAAATAGIGLSQVQFIGGSYFLPTFNLSLESDLFLQMTAAAARTATFTPIVVSPMRGAKQPQQRQLQSVPTNVSKSILADSSATV
jgi:hypothetical protein